MSPIGGLPLIPGERLVGGDRAEIAAVGRRHSGGETQPVQVAADLRGTVNGQRRLAHPRHAGAASRQLSPWATLFDFEQNE